MHPLHPLNPRALIGMIAVLGFLAVAGLLASQPGWANLAHAQDSPSVAIELSGDSVEPGTAITVTMSFGGLESDSDKATRDYIFRADVKDSDNEDADGCEDRKNGYGLGVERYMSKVDQDPEVRRGATSAGCPAGDYTVRAMIASPDNVELAWASASFSVVEPEPPPSTDATLSRLALSGIDFGAFDPAVTGYTAEVANDVAETTVTPATNHDGATYVVQLDGADDTDGVIPLSVGTNAISIVVTAEDGETVKTYTVAITRAEPPPSNDATLSGLALSGVTLAFNPSTETYTAQVGNDVDQMTVTATTNQDGATYLVRLDGADDADGTVALSVGENAVSIEVTAEDGETKKTYTVSVTRAAPALSGDATLSGLALSGVTLAFDPAITAYTADVANDVTETTITPAVNHDGATYAVKLDGVADDDATLDLAVGENAVTIEVTAEDGETAKTYAVTVTRAAPPASNDATLSGLTLSGITLAFDSATTAYTAEVGNDVTETTVAPAVNHDGATYVVKLDGVADADGTVALAVGGNAVTVEVTAEDGETAKTYTVTVTRAAPALSGDPTLSGLALSGIDFGAFDPAVAEYTAEVGNDVTETTVAPTVNHDGATYAIKLDDVADADGAVDLAVGENAVTIEVTAEDGETAKTYTVTVTRADAPPDDTPAGPAAFVGIALPSEMAEGEASKVNLAFFGLEPDSDRSTKDYVFRADVKNSENEDADACEGKGMGRDRPIWMVDQDPESRAVVISADCPAGDYTLRVSIRRPNYVRVASDRVGFTIEAPAETSRQASTVATLSRLSLSHGTLRPAFAIDTTEYRAAVANGVAQVTVLPAATDAGATVSYLDGSDAALADADDNTGGHQVAAAVGATTFKVKVTATDGVTVKTYTVVIERDSDDDYGWTPTRDLNGLNAAGNENGFGVWSGGTTMWVADWGDNKLYAYTLSGAARDSAKDMALHSDNAAAGGIWSNGSTIWVTDDTDDKLYAYTLSDGTRDTAKDIGLDADNDSLRGIWSNGTTIWVADFSDAKLYAYTLDGGARDETKDIALPADNSSPHGIWSNGTTIWVADFADDKLYAYALSGGTHDSAKDFTSLAGTGGFAGATIGPAGIWSDGTTMWALEYDVVSPYDSKIYSFNMPLASTDATLSGLTLSAGTLRPEFDSVEREYQAAVANGVAQVTVTPTVNDAGATVTYLDGSDAALPDADSGADGHQVDVAVGLTTFKVKVTAEDTTTTQTYTVVIERDSAADYGWTPTRDLNGLTAAGNRNGYGIWTDGTTIWVADNDDDKLFAYKQSTGARDSDKDITLDSANANPTGVWSNGTTIWVADNEDNKLYAYALSGGTRATAKEFALDSANDNPQSVWSDGTTIWVSDFGDGKLYAYALSDGTRATAKEFTLHASHPIPLGIWSDGTTIWVGNLADDGLYAYALDGGARQAGRDFNTLAGTGGFADTAKGPTGIASDGTTMWALGTDTISVGSKIYSFNMPPPASADATLSGLALSDGTLRPGFAADETEYRAAVGNGVSQVTVTPTATDAAATVTYLDGSDAALADADSGTPGHQVAAAVGSTTFKVKVTAADGNTVETYTVVIERDSAAAYGWTPTRDFNGPTEGISDGYGIWTDGTTMWVVNTDDTHVFAYPGANSGADLNRSFDLHADNGNPRGIWSNGTTMWVADGGDAKLYAYTLDGGARDTAKDIALDSANGSPRGIWSGGTTVWVVDVADNYVYAYALSDGTRNTAKDITTLTTGSVPIGITSDGTTMWVGDRTDKKLYAYALSGGARQAGRDFTTLTGTGGFGGQAVGPLGLVSDGATMWALETNIVSGGGKVYSFNMPPPSEADATLSALTLSTGTLKPAFAPAVTSYTAGVWSGAASVTVTATTNNANAAAVISKGGTEYADGMVPLEVGDNVITITVTPQESTAAAKTYTVTVRRWSSDATLGSLSVSPGPSVELDPAQNDYFAAVENPVSRVTVTAAPNHPSARLSIARTLGQDPFPPGQDLFPAAGVELDLTVGVPAKLRLQVISEDHIARAYYYFTIVRESVDPFGWKALDDINTLDAAGNQNPVGIWSDGTTLWAADAADDKLYAYNLDTGAREPNNDFDDVVDPRSAPLGVWGNEQTIWVLSSSDELLAFNRATKASDGDKDIVLNFDNADATDIWSDGTTMWVSDSVDSKLYAYALDGGARQPGQEFNTLNAAGNGSPWGLWSDGATMWVADDQDDRIYAYDMATRARDAARDFTTLNAAGNGEVRGIWSDGEVMWASDFEGNKVYSYNLPPSDNADLKALALSGLTLDPAFAAGTVSYAATATAASTTVTATPRQRFTRSVTITPTDADPGTGGHQVDLPDDALTVIRVRVTAQDGGSRTYTVRVTRGTPPVPADDATLIHLSLSNPADGGAITLTPPFGSDETGYTAQVDDGVSEADVSATARHPSATVAVTGGAGNVLAGPVPLDEGKNVINVTVTSADGSASKTYTVTVWRAEAPPQIIRGPYIRRDPANGQTFFAGEEIEVLVTFSEKFLVWPDSDRSASQIGTANAPFPYVELDIGGVKRRAHYWASLPTGHRWGDNPENTAIFTYEVQPGDLDRDGVSIAAGEVFLPDPAETDRPDAERPVIMAGGRWGDPYDLRHEGMAESWPVNLAAPRVVSVAFIGDGGRDNVYGEGSGVDFEVSFDEAVVVNTARGRPRLRLELERGDAPRYATYDGGSGSRTLKFFYRVQGNDRDGDGVDIAEDGLELNGGRIHSEHHSAVLARLGHAGVEGGGTRLVDGIPPSIIAVTIEADPNGAFTDIHVDFDEIMRVGYYATRKPRIETDLGDAVYHSISDRVIGGVRVSRVTFRYQGTGSVVIPSGAEITGYTGSIEDLAGNEPRSLLVDGGG